MKIETFTLRSNDTGGVAALRQVHPDCGGQNISRAFLGECPRRYT